MPGATTFPFGPPWKNVCFPAMGLFSGLIPFFGRFRLLSLRFYKIPLILTHNDNGVGPGKNYRETATFTFGRKVLFGQKCDSSPPKNPKFTKRLIFIWEKGTFLFAQLFLVVARTWLPCDPIFWQRPVFSPRRDGPFATLGSIFRLFVSELWSFFCKKKNGSRIKKSSPYPL